MSAIDQLPASQILMVMVGHMQKVFSDPKVTLTHFYTGEIEKGNGWEEPCRFRNRFRLLYRKHVESVVQQFLPQWSSSLKVMEIGAGFLVDNRSALSGYLPEADFTYSDLNKKAALLAHAKNPGVHYLHLDSSRLSEKVEPSSVDVVMASCFLDTLPSEALSKTLEQSAVVLKEGGTLFHVSELQPFVNTLVIDHKDDPEIMFPLLCQDKFVKGIQFVPKERCESYINRCKTIEAIFLKAYISLSNDARGAVAIEICTMPSKALALSNWVKQDLLPTREVDNEQFFSQRLEASLKRANFEIIQFGMRIQEVIASKSEAQEECNSVFSVHGRLIQRNVQRADDNVRKALAVHIVVARKKVLARDS